MKLAIKGLILIFTAILFNNNVYAKCADIKNVKIDGVPVGKSAIINSDGTKYRIVIKDNTSTVKIDAETDYAFVSGYEPRTVSTNEEVQIRVNGAPDCGITRYYFSFVKESQTTTTKPTTAPTTKTTTSTTSTTTTTTKKVEPIAPTPVVEEQKVKLKTFVIEGYPINFSPDITSYYIEVPNDVTEIKINAETDNPEDSILISENSKNLIEGTNTVTISVTNKDGESTIYELAVKRETSLSNNNYLSQLTIEGYSIPFAPDTYKYDLTIKEEQELTIIPVAQDENAAISITGNSSLVNGSTIKVIVTAENGEQREYTIIIHKVESIVMSILKDYWQYILIGMVGLIVLIVLIVLLIKGKKKKSSSMEPETIENNIASSTVVTPINASPSQTSLPVDNKETLPETQEQNLQVDNQIPVEGLEIVTPQVDNGDLSKTEVFKL